MQLLYELFSTRNQINVFLSTETIMFGSMNIIIVSPYNTSTLQALYYFGRSVWGRLGTLIRREGGDPRVAEMFYRAVVQVILMYGLETWIL